MHKVCRMVVRVFGVIYLLALALLIIGTFGLFGAERDPLAGAFLIPLWLPWNLLVDRFPENSWPWLAALTPALNLFILRFLCWSPARE